VPVDQAIAQPVRGPVEKTADMAPAALPSAEVRTRHATFKLAGFDELPGWEQDDLVAGWPAFRSSCVALQRRDAWREVCAQSGGVARTPVAIRTFFESRFALLRILNTDASRDGDITGYFEPLLEGRRQAQGDFNVPVLGVPRDLYTLDWINVPAPQRRAIVQVKPQGSTLVVLPAAEPGSYPLDLRRFELDTKDRRLRVRLSRAGATPRAEPYPTRGEMAALGLPGGVDAPVLAWVNDALALYAMQIQGSGRIRLADATVLRVQYADQNGHPFKPLRVVAKNSDRVVTRGIGGASNEADQFVLEADDSADAAPDRTGAADAEPDGVVTRGLSNKRPAAAGSGPERVPGQDAAANALVDELLSGKPKRAPAPAAPPTAVAAAGPAATRPAAAVPSTQAPPPQLPARPATAAARPAFSPSLLSSDPSYVFFKIAADQAPGEGPPGALGVPLTPGRSVAVDPRVTPLGYPVFLAAQTPQGSNIDMRRLVFAQDTGGAIRGAVRADFFWGFGSDAGRLARGTRHRGQMWLLMPKAEVARLGSSGIVTRGISATPRASAECLIADDAFCQEPD
jgi:membrane-bound lytic murein transglycosylase A